MTQEAIVIRTLPNQMAEVLVKRPTACGGSCGSCESCIYQSELRAFARNLINAALLVYIVPLLFFILGFAAAKLLGASEGLSILVSFLCLIPAALLLIRSHKRKTAENQIRFDIIS